MTTSTTNHAQTWTGTVTKRKLIALLTKAKHTRADKWTAGFQVREVEYEICATVHYVNTINASDSFVASQLAAYALTIRDAGYNCTLNADHVRVFA